MKALKPHQAADFAVRWVVVALYTRLIAKSALGCGGLVQKFSFLSKP
jgi:hypothetical protein